MGFPEKDLSQESDGTEADADDLKTEAMRLKNVEEDNAASNTDLKANSDNSDCESGIWLHFPKVRISYAFSRDDIRADLKSLNIDPDSKAEAESSSSRRKRDSSEEDKEKDLIQETPETVLSSFLTLIEVMNPKHALTDVAARIAHDKKIEEEDRLMDEQIRFKMQLREKNMKDKDIRKSGEYLHKSILREKGIKLAQLQKVDENPQDKSSPFYIAMEKIKQRNSDIKWVPCNRKERGFPSLVDLSLNILAKYSDAITSLEYVPDELRHTLSVLVCDKGKMSPRFLELLVRGAPTEIRVKDGSKLQSEELVEVFRACDTSNLILVQLDTCGKALRDDALCGSLAKSHCSLPNLVSISLSGAHRLTDEGLKALSRSAPALQSLNLSHCNLITSEGIISLLRRLRAVTRELYIDHCQNIDIMNILPTLRKLKCLEVLSVAGIMTVCDDFVVEIVKSRGTRLKELVLADCIELTDKAMKSVGNACSGLCALDLSRLENLTDMSIQYLTNGCRALTCLKLSRNHFSDEAIAAFLEASGYLLNELSLNGIERVGANTTLSLAKCSKNLVSLDLSWCRGVTYELLGYIVYNCSNLKLLKLFGCSQVTECFLRNHSNSKVKIVGVRMTPLLENLYVLQPQRAPLRYSRSIISCLNEQKPTGKILS